MGQQAAAMFDEQVMVSALSRALERFQEKSQTFPVRKRDKIKDLGHLNDSTKR
jgi:hypothetical protein